MESPAPEVSADMRRKALEDITRRYIADAERLNATLDEVLSVLKEQLQHQLKK
jgi:hypothetical protein